jgi:hypothetical protein
VLMIERWAHRVFQPHHVILQQGVFRLLTRF